MHRGKNSFFNSDADNEKNEYLIDAGDLKQFVYQLKFRQGILNHFVDPRLDSENSQNSIIHPQNIEKVLEFKPCLANI